jgi:type I restriction enzyme S subunit
MDAKAKMPTYEVYRDSGEEWIGSIPREWNLVPLRSVFRFRNEKNDPIKTENILSLSIASGVTQYSDEGRGGNKRKDDLTAYKIAHPNDIVLNSMNVIVGAVGLSKYYGAISPVYYALYSANSDVDVKYYENIFQNEGFQRGLLKFGKGILIKLSGTGKLNTIRMKVSVDDLKTLYFPKPPIEDQRLIANFLDQKAAQIYEAIAIKEQQIALLKERKQIIIQKAVTQGLNPDAPMKDSGVDWIGEIPEHWSYEPIKYSLNGIVDCEHKTAPFVDDQEYFVVRTTNVKDGKLSLDGAKYTTEQGYKEWTRRGVPVPGDILLTREAPAGEACLVPSGMKICLGQRMVWLKVRGDRLLPDFIISLIYSTVGRTYIDFLSSGSTVLHFNMADINNIPVLIPPMSEQRELVDYIAKVTEESERVIELQKEQIYKLKEYKTTLINSAVTGKIRITPEMVA